ncbi:MAG: hypothetical protein J7K68_06135 [Candidatus Diapherotrites archaeon]|nr:hypothetical protein [Candidatus Diapherotrites archaeon]
MPSFVISEVLYNKNLDPAFKKLKAEEMKKSFIEFNRLLNVFDRDDDYFQNPNEIKQKVKYFIEELDKTIKNPEYKRDKKGTQREGETTRQHNNFPCCEIYDWR